MEPYKSVCMRQQKLHEKITENVLKHFKIMYVLICKKNLGYNLSKTFYFTVEVNKTMI